MKGMDCLRFPMSALIAATSYSRGCRVAQFTCALRLGGRAVSWLEPKIQGRLQRRIEASRKVEA
jgi:predicted DNA-binding transcriptional regulator AlpA